MTPTGAVVPVTNSTPYITNALLTLDGLELSGTNGTPNAYYRVVASSNLSAPQNSWPAIATNTFDVSGNFDDINPVAPAVAAQFYRLFSPGGGSPPTISSPLQNQTVIAGQNALFTVSVGGDSPFGYQWYFNGGTLLVGETNASLTVTNAQTNNAGGYSVIVTNNYGAATSAVATLAVITASPSTGMVGYVTVGYTPTSGAGGTTQTVTTASAFAAAVTSTAKQVIYVQGTIDVRSISSVNMKIGNKTIIGLGTNATILGDLGIKHSTNVIVRNLFFTNPGTGNGSGGAGDGDGITVQFADHVWVGPLHLHRLRGWRVRHHARLRFHHGLLLQI